MEKSTQCRNPPPGAYRPGLNMYNKVGRGSKHPTSKHTTRGLPRTSPHSPLRTSPHSPLRTSPHSPLRNQSCQGRNADSPCGVFQSIGDLSSSRGTPSPPVLRAQPLRRTSSMKKVKKGAQQAAHTSGNNASGVRSTATSGAGALGMVGGGSAASLTIFAGGLL